MHAEKEEETKRNKSTHIQLTNDLSLEAVGSEVRIGVGSTQAK